MNKEKSNIYMNIDKQTFEYIGIYALLDELLTRIKKCHYVCDLERYCRLYEKIYILSILGCKDNERN